MLSVVCQRCSRVSRVPLDALLAAGAWTCSSCGAVKPLGNNLPRNALAALAATQEPRPVFSESYSKARVAGRP